MVVKMIPVDVEDEGYRFYKTLNEDIQLKPDEYNQWDMVFENGDIVNLTGHDSLRNAICIAIMTRYRELKHNQLYDEFGCRVHELIKANKSRMTEYKIELFIDDVLTHMRRVKSVNYIEITDNPHGEHHKYRVDFSVTSISDKTVQGRVNL